MSAYAERLDTAVANLPYAPPTFGADYLARLRIARRGLDDTVLLAFPGSVPAPEPADRTESTEAETRAMMSYVVGEASEIDEERGDEALEDRDVAGAQRVGAARRELLAHRFARKQLSPEYVARLEILEERLRALAPHVTEEALEALEEAQARIDSADDLLERVRRELATE